MKHLPDVFAPLGVLQSFNYNEVSYNPNRELFKYRVTERDLTTKHYATTFNNMHHYKVVGTDDHLRLSRRVVSDSYLGFCFKNITGNPLIAYRSVPFYPFLTYYTSLDNIISGFMSFAFDNEADNVLSFKNSNINTVIKISRVIPTEGYVSTDGINFTSMTDEEDIFALGESVLEVPFFIAQTGMQLYRR